MEITYDRYLDKILGGWIGKSAGGAIGARFEGTKGWIEIRPDEMFPDEMPPNDDLDLQILWLKVLEEQGPALTSDDLATAWLEGCWYPFNEYGIFRRNWRLGIHPPTSGAFTNQFWETGMGCPIRAEVWGYVLPGAPDLAAQYAHMDGVLDHTAQSVGAEMMFAAMASMAFFEDDVRRLAARALHFLPADTPISRLTHAAFAAYDAGLSLREARDRIMMMEGVPEACDAQINVPFTFLGLLYGGTDIEAALLAALRCGYDTDCTLATAGALIGQILGARRIPDEIKAQVGDELVMGIEYRRPEMTLSALARDTARIGVLMTEALDSGVAITGTPELAPLPATAEAPAAEITVAYRGLPAAAPGDRVVVSLSVAGEIPSEAKMSVDSPEGWAVTPDEVSVDPLRRVVDVTLQAPHHPEVWPEKNLFTARLGEITHAFGVAGAALWHFLGAYFDALPDPDDELQQRRRFHHHFADLQTHYLPEPDIAQDVDLVRAQFSAWSRTLGRPAVVAGYEREVDPTRLVGLRGPYCAYFSRTIVSPKARKAWFVIGNTDPYRLYLNGELIAEVEESVWWTPFNNAHLVELQDGPNHILLKLVKQRDDMRFTFGARAWGEVRSWHNGQDWLVDLADVVYGVGD